MKYTQIYQQYMYSYPHKSTYQRTERLDLSAYRDAFIGKEMGLYFHIPFCRAKCGYCNLFSLAGIRAEGYAEYIKAIKRHSVQIRQEIELGRTSFSTLIFGGGTPLLLSVKELGELFDLAESEYRVVPEEIFSVIESSPLEITSEKLDFLRERKLKRLSIGIQSFAERELKTLERPSTAQVIHQALERAKQADFPILNLDLIYGIPEQTEQSWRSSLKQAVAYEPEGIYLYPLYNQPNAGLYHKFKSDEEHSRRKYELYWIGSQFLKESGYLQKSMRCFSRSSKPLPIENTAEEYACQGTARRMDRRLVAEGSAMTRENDDKDRACSSLWQRKEKEADCGFDNTLALGCGGRSYINELHFCEPYVAGQEACWQEYQAYLAKDDFLAGLSMARLTKDQQKRRYVIKNILYYTGLSLDDYWARFAARLWEDFPVLKEMQNRDWLIEDNGRLYLTELGMSLSDYIGPRLART